MTEPYELDILMATYNGAAYLERQLQSILTQVTGVRFRLVVSDDRSSDETGQLLTQLSAAWQDDRLVILPPDTLNRGAVGRFEFLLTQSSAPYIMFSDQDDVWLPDKIELSWRQMQALERAGDHGPALIFTDLTVVSQSEATIDQSIYQRHRIRTPQSAQHLLMRNTVVGCTVLANRALVELALPFPKIIYMHDWWFAILAAFSGQLGYLGHPTILYRQHGSNTVGAGEGNRLRRLIKRLSFAAIQGTYTFTVQQARSLEERLADRQYPARNGPLLHDYLATSAVTGPRKLALLLRHNFVFGNPLYRLAMLAALRNTRA